MHTNSLREDRPNNSFVASLIVAMTMLTGFIVAVMGVALTSAALAVTGLIVLLGGLGLYRLLLI